MRVLTFDEILIALAKVMNTAVRFFDSLEPAGRTTLVVIAALVTLLGMPVLLLVLPGDVCAVMVILTAMAAIYRILRSK